MAENHTIQKLQSLIVEAVQAKQQKGKRSIEDITSDALALKIGPSLKNIIDDDTYFALYKAGREGLLDINELLIDGIALTIEKGEEFFQLIGLALKLGATPNLYVSTLDTVGNLTVVHLLYYTWLKTPQTYEQVRFARESVNNQEITNEEIKNEIAFTQSMMLDVIALLAVAGSDIEMPITDAATVLERQRAVSPEASQAKVFMDTMPPHPIWRMMELENPELFKLVSARYNLFFKNRTNLGEYSLEDPLAREIIELLDLSDQIRVIEKEQINDKGIIIIRKTTVPSLSRCIDLFANKCVESILKMTDTEDTLLSAITLAEAEAGFVKSAEVYNIHVSIELLKSGVKPHYGVIDRIVLVSERKVRQKLIASSAVLNGILVEMVARGVGIDEEQLRIVGLTSPSTFKEIRKLQTIPYWQRTCGVPGWFIRPDLQKLARELNLPVTSSKDDICAEFQKMDSADAKSLRVLSSKLQEKRMTAKVTSIGDIVEARSHSKSDKEHKIEKPIQNANLLSRDPTDYADIDLVLVDESDVIYAFESRDYETLLEPDVPINPITGNRLPITVVEEIQTKLFTLKRAGLPIESKGIMASIQDLKAPEKDNYEGFIKSRVRKFFMLAEDHRIDSKLFKLKPSEGGLTNEEMEEIIKEFLGDKSVVFNIDSREACVRSFASTIMEELDVIDNMKKMRNETDDELYELKQNRVDEIFATLYNLIGQDERQEEHDDFR